MPFYQDPKYLNIKDIDILLSVCLINCGTFVPHTTPNCLTLSRSSISRYLLSIYKVAVIKLLDIKLIAIQIFKYRYMQDLNINILNIRYQIS